MNNLKQSLSQELSRALGQPINVTKQDVKDAIELAEGSDIALGTVLPYVQSIAGKLGLHGESACVEAPAKTLYRIFYKAVANYNKVVSDVPDIGRMRLLIETPKQIEQLRKMFLGSNPEYAENRIGLIVDPHPTNEITTEEFEDFYHVPSSTGRIGIHLALQVKIPGNKLIPFEIQILHKDMVSAEELTRSNYLNAQAIKRTASNEGRELTTEEDQAVKSYDISSQERYTADALRLNLFGLRRSDLCHAKAVRGAEQHLQLVA